MGKDKIFNISAIHQTFWKEFCDVCYARFGFEKGEERTYEQKYETFCRCKAYVKEEKDYEQQLMSVREQDLSRLKSYSDWFFSSDDIKDIVPALYTYVRMMWTIEHNLQNDILLIKYICPRKPKIKYSTYRLDVTRRLLSNDKTFQTFEQIKSETDAVLLKEIIGDEASEHYPSGCPHEIDVNDRAHFDYDDDVSTIISVVNDILKTQQSYFNNCLNDFIEALPEGTECPRGNELPAFLYRLFMSYEDSLLDINEELEELPAPMILVNLKKENEILIQSFFNTPLGKRWKTCMEFEDGLKHFANYFMHHRKDFTEEDEQKFFYTLDKICIINDVLDGNVDNYWFNVDLVKSGSYQTVTIDLQNDCLNDCTSQTGIIKPILDSFLQSKDDELSKDTMVLQTTPANVSINISLVQGDQVMHKDANIDKNFGTILSSE